LCICKTTQYVTYFLCVKLSKAPIKHEEKYVFHCSNVCVLVSFELPHPNNPKSQNILVGAALPLPHINSEYPSPFYLFDLKRIKTISNNDDLRQ